MNYYGYLLRPELIDAAQAGRLIKLVDGIVGRIVGGRVATLVPGLAADISVGAVLARTVGL